MTKIFLDLDGVCVNLQAEMLRFINKPPDYEPKNWSLYYDFFSERVAKQKKKEFFEALGRHGWANLEPYREFPYLLSWGKSKGEVIFLTAPPDWGVSEAAIGKIMWAKKHAPDIPIIITQEKHLFSEEKTILIDDRIENCIKFNAGLGTALLWPHSSNLHYKELAIFDKTLLGEIL